MNTKSGFVFLMASLAIMGTVQACAGDKPAADSVPASVKADLRTQIEKCWAVPAGMQDKIIDLVIDVKPDHTVAAAKPADSGRYAFDPDFHTAADAAVQAAQDKRCSTLKLPDDQYDQWKQIDLTMDPKDIR